MEANRRSLGGVGLGMLIFLAGCGGNGREHLVVYTSQDQVYAEPILREFTRETGIEVRAVYDSEAVKTVGLANRLLMERGNPQCDLFWNNEELRTWQLAERDVFREEDGIEKFGYRSRRMVINTNHLDMAKAPRSMRELTNEVWRGKVALAYPLFGTTATHFLALRRHWGEEEWRGWCEALLANQPFLVDGNSVVVKLVGQGEAWIGLTDSDDIAAGRREGLPVAAAALDGDSLLIANTAALVRGAPRPDLAEQLLAYLRRKDVLEQLVAVNALEGISPEDISVKTIQPDWEMQLPELEEATEVLRKIFLR